MEHVAPNGVVDVAKEWDCNGLVEGGVCCRFDVVVFPRAWVEGVRDEEQGPGDPDLGGDLDCCLAGVHQPHSVAGVDGVAVAASRDGVIVAFGRSRVIRSAPLPRA